jgi:hypothetical protein
MIDIDVMALQNHANLEKEVWDPCAERKSQTQKKKRVLCLYHFLK